MIMEGKNSQVDIVETVELLKKLNPFPLDAES